MQHLPQPVRARAFTANRVVRRPSKTLQTLAAAQQQDELEKTAVAERKDLKPAAGDTAEG